MSQPNSAGESILDLGNPSGRAAFVQQAADPVVSPSVYTPTEFAYEYPTPLDPLEVMAMCEEMSVWQAIPELFTGLKEESWREEDELYFTGSSGSWTNLTFRDGDCPEEYTHDGENMSVDLKNIGAKKGLTISDIMHSAAVASGGCGITGILGGFSCSSGAPGGTDVGTFLMEHIANVKEKEIRKAMSLVLNGWDDLLVNGNATTNALQFDGIVASLPSSCAHTNGASGTFTAIGFDRFLAEACAKPTHIFGHPQAIQEMLSGYFQLGFQGSQVVNFTGPANRITPGFNFAGFVNTGVGQMAVVADCNFERGNMTGSFIGALYALRMNHNGEPLVYKRTQIPLAYRDLTPGCTTISFEIWAKTALIVKACCAHNVYTATFTGRIVTTCPTVG